MTKELEKEATEAWVNYGKAIQKVFGFKGFIVAGPLLKVISTGSEEKVRRFISYVKAKTEELQDMK